MRSRPDCIGTSTNLAGNGGSNHIFFINKMGLRKLSTLYVGSVGGFWSYNAAFTKAVWYHLISKAFLKLLVPLKFNQDSALEKVKWIGLLIYSHLFAVWRIRIRIKWFGSSHFSIGIRIQGNNTVSTDPYPPHGLFVPLNKWEAFKMHRSVSALSLLCRGRYLSTTD